MVSLYRTRGVGMVEILVTMFVLTIGLLGVASLQFVGSFTNADALSRTQAEFVAQQAAERLQSAAVSTGASQGAFVPVEFFTASNYNFEGFPACGGGGSNFECYCEARPAAVPDCESGRCSTAQMAIYDGWSLACGAVQVNDNTQISVVCTDNLTRLADGIPCSPGSFIDIRLSWPLRLQQTVEAQNDPNCPQIDGEPTGCVTKRIVQP